MSSSRLNSKVRRARANGVVFFFFFFSFSRSLVVSLWPSFLLGRLMICYYHWRASLRTERTCPVQQVLWVEADLFLLCFVHRKTGVESSSFRRRKDRNIKKLCKNNIKNKTNEVRLFWLYECRIISEVESRNFPGYFGIFLFLGRFEARAR